MPRKVATGTAGRKGLSGVRDAYHHGALRETLLEAAEAVLEAVGVEGFTLRECARRAGVSHGAPAHHFGDVRGLLSEFTAVSFKQLDDLTREYRKEAAADAFSQLQAGGLAYIDYALAHRARFQLMFRSDRLDPGNEGLVEAGKRVFSHLQESIAAVSEAGGAKDEMLPEKISIAWTMVHGFALLMLENVLFASRVGDGPKEARALFCRMLHLSRPAFEARGGSRAKSRR
jgi:AcrR family transcriptional regulator